MNSDLYAYESSKMGNMQMENPVDKKNVVEINDSNTGNYSSNILRYDLSSLYNQSLFVDWDAPNSYLAIPMVTHLNLKSNTPGDKCALFKPTASGVGFNNNALAYKNGFYQLIDNVSLKCGNNQLSSNNGNLNILNNFKNLTIYSRDNLENGDIWGFYPDNYDTWDYLQPGGTVGTNIQARLENNSKDNLGFVKRLKRLGMNISGNGARNNKGSDVLLGNSSVDSGFDTVVLENAQNLVYRNVFYIKMRDLSDFFKKVGYSRFYCTLEIQLNIGSCEFILPAKTTNAVYADTDMPNISKSSFQKTTCPFMISKLGEGLNILAGANASPEATTLTITNGVAKVIFDGVSYTHPFPNTTLYCQTVQLKPRMEEMILSNKNKQIVYEDFYQAETIVAKDANLNYIATNGIANLKAVLLVPFVAPVHNLGYSPLASPLTSEPGTTSAVINLINLQILLAGERILPSEIKYNFKNWLDNDYGCRSINGGRTPELNNGLISYQAFLNNYRYMYFDVSHIDNLTPKAITVIAKNESGVDIQLMVFAIYDKRVNLNVASGELNVE